uniref:Ras-GEF domain-containing protein n=1 Tax=Steinernema glaseri TaxID=37863 RepID=A0A1I8A9D8_9BILA
FEAMRPRVAQGILFTAPNAFIAIDEESERPVFPESALSRFLADIRSASTKFVAVMHRHLSTLEGAAILHLFNILYALKDACRSAHTQAACGAMWMKLKNEVKKKYKWEDYAVGGPWLSLLLECRNAGLAYLSAQIKSRCYFASMDPNREEAGPSHDPRYQ